MMGAVVLAVRGAWEKSRRVTREERCRGFRHHISKLVYADVIPHVEEKTPSGPEDPVRLRVTFDPVRIEHHAELAAYAIKRSLVEGQFKCVGLLPANPVIESLFAGCVIKHWLVEVADNVVGIGCQARGEGARYNTTAGRRL